MADFVIAGPLLPYAPDDGGAGSIAATLLEVLDAERAAHPGERLDAIGIHPRVFDALYVLVHGELLPNRSAITARRLVGDDFETAWIYPDPELESVNQVLCGRRRMT